MSKKEIKAYCKRRARKVEGLVLGAYDEHDLESSISDCLADIMHLCAHKKLDYIQISERARNNFNAEVMGGEHG